MPTDARILEAGLAQLYARALVAIARADEQLGLEEGLRLQRKLALRSELALPLEDLLLAEPLDPEVLARALRDEAGPFRGGGLHPGQLAQMIVVDAVEVVLAKGYISESEAAEVFRFATALGCTEDEVRGMTRHLAPWLPRR